MDFPMRRPLSLIAISWFGCGSVFSQTTFRQLTAASKIEPGLDPAVNWKWWVAPPESGEWGMELPEALRPKTPGSVDAGMGAPAEARPETYEVRKGDAIIKIARKFDMSAAQLKQFNDLKDDRIIIGQVLRIPTPGDLLTMVPPPPPPPDPKEKAATGKKRAEVPETDLDPYGELQQELDNVRLQVFLDREMFSPGAIDGKPGDIFLKTSGIYQQTHLDTATPELLKMKAVASIPEPYTRYVLRVDDFKFIRLPKEEPVPPPTGNLKSVRKKGSGKVPPPPPRQVTTDDMLADGFLGYTSAWEFVAERFHCDEEFLHHINPQLKGTPVVGSEFQVPNVIPFEIETAADHPLQPVEDPLKPVTAAVVSVSRLEISCDGKLIAVMPLATARPGLHGRGSWTVLDAIPRPRMATKREPREPPKTTPETAGAPPETATSPDREQFLAPGPNNPVGIIWINLAKSNSRDPLPYGLHGTGMPSRMYALQGIGGFRLANWNIARAARLLPAGTALQWKAK